MIFLRILTASFSKSDICSIACITLIERVIWWKRKLKAHVDIIEWAEKRLISFLKPSIFLVSLIFAY